MKHEMKLSENIFYLPTHPIGSRLIADGHFTKLAESLAKKNKLPEGSIRIQNGPTGADEVRFSTACDTEKIFRLIRDEYTQVVKEIFKRAEMKKLEAL